MKKCSKGCCCPCCRCKCARCKKTCVSTKRRRSSRNKRRTMKSYFQF